ncbi:putative methyltransferase [Trypanosoma rangeli]|uniref:Putative methyltransferase n=1 Tax=Trypanosoma rangeli TaxID=5698 RepID=A0A422N3J7_TRYRA|nr:putative methyltransferase [Trypanosoma rangeli]RNF00021.1 putative methyltransferase [Trypanosoma rangeli]|eukprot:RNF00021.1 putative methyltransferase [Trypanosoma rangeli]
MMDFLKELKNILVEQNKFVVIAAVAAVASSAVTATTVCLLSKRNTKKNGMRDVSAGGEEPQKSHEIYETQASARQYMEFHYTPSRTSFAQRLRTISESFDFPFRVAQKFKEFLPEAQREDKRALDIGCATGASVLEMSKYFGSVIGIDYSETFIHFANEILKESAVQHGARIAFTAADQGDMEVSRNVRVPLGAFPKRCQFFRADAMDLFEKGDHGAGAEKRPPSRYADVSWYQVPAGELFDGVLVANLLCRVPDPRKLLDAFPQLLRKDGILVLASPYSWWEGATPKSKWIGGLPGGPRSEDAVKEILMKNFDLLSETEEAFLIRDHVRRYQLGFSHCTVWRRR